MPVTTSPATEVDRVRRATSQEVLREIECRIEHNIRYYSVQKPEAIDQRISELKREWSIERYLQLNVSAVGLITGLLALTSSRKWAVLTCGAVGFLLYHSLRGVEPPLPLLRRMGVRTRREIDRELYALRALRGDFEKMTVRQPHGTNVNPADVLRAVNA